MNKHTRQVIFDKLDGHCAYCGEEIAVKDMQVDHIVPKCTFEWHIKNQYKIPLFLKHLTVVDVNHIDNLMPACRVCNKWKSAHSLEQFRTELSEQITRLNGYSANYRIAKRYLLLQETIKPIEFYFEKTERLDKILNDPELAALESEQPKGFDLAGLKAHLESTPTEQLQKEWDEILKLFPSPEQQKGLAPIKFGRNKCKRNNTDKYNLVWGNVFNMLKANKSNEDKATEITKLILWSDGNTKKK